MAKRNVILVRPARTSTPIVRKVVGNSNPTTPTHAHTCASERTYAQRSENLKIFHVAAYTHVRAADEGESRAQANSAATIDQLLEQLAALSPTDQKVFLDRAAANRLLVAEKPADREIGMWSVAVYEAYCAAVGVGGAAGVGPLVVRRLLGASTPWSAVQSFMTSSRLHELPVTDRQAVYVLLADLLVRHTRSLARHVGAPFSPKLLASCTSNISALFDEQFPGYVEAGLVKFVARQMHAARKD